MTEKLPHGTTDMFEVVVYDQARMRASSYVEFAVYGDECRNAAPTIGGLDDVIRVDDCSPGVVVHTVQAYDDEGDVLKYKIREPLNMMHMMERHEPMVEISDSG